MKSTPINLLIITPVMPPAIGGGAIYTKLLAHGLLDYPEIGSIVIVTEKYPGCPEDEFAADGRIYIKRLFPFRCGNAIKEKSRYLKYMYQNMQMFSIGSMLKKYHVTHVMVHNYFHNNFSLMGLAARLLRTKYHVSLILDVRDPRISPKRFGRLYIYDKVICCSENVFQHFMYDSKLKDKLVLIPIIIDLRAPSREEIEQCQIKYGLRETPYIFNASGIYHGKGTDITIDLIETIRRRGEDYVLVIAGKRRDWSAKHDDAVQQGILKYLGIIPRGEVLCLSAGASLHANLSHLKIDSMPRASLEAMALGARVLLPKGVPEFDADCPEYVAVSGDLDQLAQQTINILHQKDFCLRHDYRRYAPDHVIPQYVQLLKSLP